MTIGNRISELRKAKGYTQEYIAEQLGVSRQAVSKWEQDLSSPDTGNLIALSKLLGTTIEYLATGSTESMEQKEAYRGQLRELYENRKSAGIGLLIVGVIFLFIFPLLGLILVIVGIVQLFRAGDLKDKLYLAETEIPQEHKVKENKIENPWICYACGQENGANVKYCTSCNTSKEWSEKQSNS